jgi:hypothetical protein
MYEAISSAYRHREARGGPTGMASRKKSSHPHK